MFRSVRFKLMMVYLLLMLFAMQFIGAYFIQALNRYVVRNYSHTITHEATFLASVAAPLLTHSPHAAGIRELLKPFSELAGSTVYILDKDGTVVATSASPFLIGQKRVDPEVTGALLGLTTEEIGFDPYTGQRHLYLAVPVKRGPLVVGAVEFVAPMTAIYQSISRIIILLATGTLLALGLTALLAVIIARTITGPVTAITRTARALAAGDFSQQVTIHSNDEIGELADTFNMLTRRLRQAMQSTERETLRLQAVMSTMSDGVIATNAADDILLINPAASQLLRCTGAVVGTKLSTVLPGNFQTDEMHEIELGDRVVVAMVTALGGARGTERPEDKLDDRSGRRGRVLILRDVTEESRLEASRRRFVADVSHELRTPVTTIKSYIEALLEGAYKDEQLATQFLRVMDRETNRMVRLIRDLLQLTRFDAGYETLGKEPVSVRDLVNRLAERFAMVAFKSDLQFVVEPAVECLVSVDRDRIDQVFDNIVSNSLKHTPKHGAIRVHTRIDDESKMVEFIMSDSGTGIDEKELSYIFDRFYRVDKARSRQYGGTGLGLAIAREIILAHEGEIRAESTLGKGTTVRVFLPIYDVADLEGESR